MGMPGAEAGPPSGHPVRRVIGDSSTGTRIRATEPKPSETHNARGEDAQGQTVLAQQCSRYFFVPPLFIASHHCLALAD